MVKISCLCCTFLVLLQCFIGMPSPSRSQPHDENTTSTEQTKLEDPFLHNTAVRINFIIVIVIVIMMFTFSGWFIFMGRFVTGRLGDSDIVMVTIVLEVLWMCIREYLFYIVNVLVRDRYSYRSCEWACSLSYNSACIPSAGTSSSPLLTMVTFLMGLSPAPLGTL